MPNPSLKALGVLVGSWTILGEHPLVPSTTLHGQVDFGWIESGAFLKMTTAIAHPLFPDGISIIGSDDTAGHLSMLYLDQRAVSRIYSLSIEGNVCKWWRDDPKLSQRFTVTINEGGDTMSGKGKMSQNGSSWEKDLDLVYTRIS